MRKDIEYFKNEAINRNLCSVFVDTWSKAQSKDDHFRLALHPMSIPYMAMSIHEGWGLDREFLETEYSDYINGKVEAINITQKGKQVKSKMYVGVEDRSIAMNSNIVFMIECKNVFVRCYERAISYHVSNNSSAFISLPDSCIAFIYLYDNSSINLGYVKEGQRITIIDYRKEEDIPYEEREITSLIDDNIISVINVDPCINFIEQGGNVKIRKRNLQLDAYAVNHQNI